MFSEFSKLFYTLAPLRFEQIFYRIFYKFKNVSISQGPSKISTKQWCWDGPRIFKQSIFENNRVRFLSLDGIISNLNSWNCESKEKLWLYNLHYFDDLNSSSFNERIALQGSFLDMWIEHNPPCFGNGWEPYPLSLRLVNLVKWLSCHSNVKRHWLHSLLIQASALAQQLEYHILGNHLFANAKALTFVGAFLDTDEANQYLDLGLKLLDREIPEQFLEDGGHFELSPMYHAILLWDLLELINLAQTSGNKKLLSRLPKWRSHAEKSLSWLSLMTHPDGEISFFNDSALGIAATPSQIFKYAHFSGLRWDSHHNICETLPQSSYSRISFDNYSLFFDHANVGPDYLPGHAHADTLSFELSILKQRVFVNSGTSLYGTSPERLRQRQTPAHNTISVEGLDSSQVWSGFRVAKRAYTNLIYSTSDTNSVCIEAKHDGYLKQPPKVVHSRKLECSKTIIKITDTLSKPCNAIYHLHLHPDVVIHKISDNKFSLSIDSSLICYFESSEPLIIKDSTWHPEFGKSIPNKKIEIDFKSGFLNTWITILESTI